MNKETPRVIEGSEKLGGKSAGSEARGKGGTAGQLVHQT